MKITILLGFVLCFCSLALAKPKVANAWYSEECKPGPSYWCKNITTSQVCGAVKHCINYVWPKLALEEDTDKLCTICKDAMARAKALLKSNETEVKIKKVIVGFCKFIPEKVVSKECIKLSDDYIFELVESLASQMSPQVICATADFCNSKQIDFFLQSSKQENSATDQSDVLDKYYSYGKECYNCHKLVTVVEKRITQVTDSEIIGNILGLCGYMGSYSSSCQQAVFANSRSLLNYIRNLNVNDLCDLAGVCKGKYHNHAQIKVEFMPRGESGVIKSSGEECQFCEALVQHLRDILVLNTTMLEFQHVLQGICRQTHSFKSECLSLVSEHYVAIYDFLVHHLDPRVVCDLAAICHEEAEKFKHPYWLELTVAHSGPVDMSLEALGIAAYNSGDQNNPNTDLTGTSKSNLGKVVRIPTMNHNSNIKSMIMDYYALPIERMLPPALIKDANMCIICEYQMAMLINANVKGLTDVNDIKQLAYKSCASKSIADLFMESECYNFLNLYLGKAVPLLLEIMDPNLVCSKLQVCSGAMLLDDGLSNNINQNPPTLENDTMERTLTALEGTTCVICEYAMSQIDDMLKNNATEEDIKKAVHTVCNYLPKSVSKECKAFVDEYADMVIALLIQSLDPKYVCVELSLCKPDKPKVQPLQDHVQKTPHPQDPVEVLSCTKKGIQSDDSKCIICEFLMTELVDMLKKNATESDIKRAVHNVCNHLPKTVSVECNDFVNEYADMVIALLIQSMDPTTVCVEMSLCKPNAQLNGF